MSRSAPGTRSAADPSQVSDHPALARFTAFSALDPAELRFMAGMASRGTRLERGRHLQEEGAPSAGMCLLLSGWTASSINVSEGKRQILKVHLPGDLIGLPGMCVQETPDTVVALTAVEFVRISLDSLGTIFQRHPRVAALLFLISQEERLMLMDRLAMVGSHDVMSRIAGIFLQLRSRMLRQNPSLADTFHLPLSQGDLADMIGATTIHTNRMLNELKTRHVLTWSRNKAVVHDLEALKRISGLPERPLTSNLAWLP